MDDTSENALGAAEGNAIVDTDNNDEGVFFAEFGSADDKANYEPASRLRFGICKFWHALVRIEEGLVL